MCGEAHFQEARMDTPIRSAFRVPATPRKTSTMVQGKQRLSGVLWPKGRRGHQQRGHGPHLSPGFPERPASYPQTNTREPQYGLAPPNQQQFGRWLSTPLLWALATRFCRRGSICRTTWETSFGREVRIFLNRSQALVPLSSWYHGC